MNTEGTKDGMYWAAIVQDEVQYQLNETGKTDIKDIDILSYYWKSCNKMLMVKVGGFYTLGNEVVKGKYVRVELTRRTCAVND